jgi:hypothetical protein
MGHVHDSVALAILRQNVAARYEAMMSIQHASQDAVEHGSCA